jgi:acyl-CoA hydrolase
MYGDALLNPGTLDLVLENPDLQYKIFGPPKMAVTDRDFLIGLYISTLIRDGGELQVGIGTIGDGLVYALLLRHRQNEIYQALLRDFDVIENFGSVIDKIGGTTPFEAGLFAASEMVIDGFIELYNAGNIDETITPRMLDLILMRKGIHESITEEDFEYLQKFEIFKRELAFSDGEITEN